MTIYYLVNHFKSEPDVRLWEWPVTDLCRWTTVIAEKKATLPNLESDPQESRPYSLLLLKWYAERKYASFCQLMEILEVEPMHYLRELLSIKVL